MAHSITIEENPVYAKHCISKVHDELRKVKPECYKPVLVSIGPYYHKCPDLEAMQQFKQLYLDSLLKRRNERRNERPESRENYLSELAELETKTRKCYADPMSTIKELCCSEFTDMMLLDSCFVVEFIRKMNYVPYDENDPIPDNVKADFDYNDPIGKAPWMLNQIRRDMILLENQLPYFVLSKFYDMTKYDGEKSLEEMAMSCFNASLPRPCLYSSNSNGEEINHLLHLVHIFCRPSAQRQDSSAKEVHIGTVVELQEAGVRFKKVGLEEGTWNDYVSLFDIEFKRPGVMKVPCFKVDAATETLLRNLIAYEQEYFKDVEPKYFTDFSMLMNQLINTENDIKELRYQDIIINYLGDDKNVSQLFNTLTIGVYDSEKSYFLEVRENVNKHWKNPFNRMKPHLNRDFFKQPLNLTLFYLTVLQTIIAIIALRATK